MVDNDTIEKRARKDRARRPVQQLDFDLLTSDEEEEESGDDDGRMLEDEEAMGASRRFRPSTLPNGLCVFGLEQMTRLKFNAVLSASAIIRGRHRLAGGGRSGGGRRALPLKKSDAVENGAYHLKIIFCPIPAPRANYLFFLLCAVL